MHTLWSSDIYMLGIFVNAQRMSSNQKIFWNVKAKRGFFPFLCSYAWVRNTVTWPHIRFDCLILKNRRVSPEENPKTLIPWTLKESITTQIQKRMEKRLNNSIKSHGSWRWVKSLVIWKLSGGSYTHWKALRISSSHFVGYVQIVFRL